MANGRVYSVVSSAQAETVATDLIEVVAATLSQVQLISVQVSQTTEEADAQDEMLAITIKRQTGAFTGGSGGAGATPNPVDFIDTAASFTAEVSNTTVITGGAAQVIVEDAFNVRAGYLWIPLEEQRIICDPTDAIVISVEAAADSVSFTATAFFREFGT